VRNKELKIGIIGIPIQLEKKQKRLSEFFKPGLTDFLRAKTKKFIQTKIKGENILIKILDLGELFDKKYKLASDGELVGISKSCLDKLVEELKRKMEGIDFLIVYGGAHTGGYLLYNLPGKIERFDLHEDDDNINIPFHTSYMNYVSTIKDHSDLSNHNLPGLLDEIFDRSSVDANVGRIFDIDIDYYNSTEYCKLKKEDEERNFNRIISAIKKAKPKVIGLFEFQRLNKNEYEKMLEIVWQGIKAN